MEFAIRMENRLMFSANNSYDGKDGVSPSLNSVKL
jgi:hypothetical protein